MKLKTLIIAILLSAFYAGAQNKTDNSLFLKKDKTNYLTEIESESGNLFTKPSQGNHGDNHVAL